MPALRRVLTVGCRRPRSIECATRRRLAALRRQRSTTHAGGTIGAPELARAAPPNACMPGATQRERVLHEPNLIAAEMTAAGRVVAHQVGGIRLRSAAAERRTARVVGAQLGARIEGGVAQAVSLRA